MSGRFCSSDDHSIGDEPDGRTSTQAAARRMENIAGFVRENAPSARLTARRSVLAGGEIYNGDHLIYVFARHMLEGSLNGRGVVLRG